VAKPAWIRVIKEREATGNLREVYDQVIAARGSNFNITRAASLWPELLALQEKEFELFHGPETLLDPDIKDLIGAHVGQLNHCEYCSHWYRAALTVRGWSDEKITHILQDIESEHLDKASRAIMVFADKVTRTPQSMGHNDIVALRTSGVEDRRILEAAAITGYFNYLTRLANALGVITD